MIILICGGRDFKDQPLFDWGIAFVKGTGFDLTHVIAGGARGADTMARNWAEAHRVPYHEFFADWAKHGKSAGVIRNKQMLVEGFPDLVLAMPGGTGTANMIRQALEAGVRVCKFDSNNHLWRFV